MDHHEVMEKVLVHIEEHLDQPLSLESVADTFYMSKYYFHRLFSAMTGSSLHTYILTRRLNAALKLVQSGGMSLTEIAYVLNFGTPASFSRAFRRQYGVAPSSLRATDIRIAPAPVPSVVKRSIKHINGDIVSDFTLTDFEPIRVSGVAFEVDLAADDYKSTIRSQARRLLAEAGQEIQGRCYMVYSNCRPGSTRFKALFAIPLDLQINKPYHFVVDLPQLFCARFTYTGDLLEIGDVLKTDYARFLKISRQEPEDCPIELIQVFEDVHDPASSYHIYAPIKKLPIDSVC